MFPTALVEHLQKFLAEIKEVVVADFQHLSVEERKEKAKWVRDKCAIYAAGISPLPIPFADIWTITPVQMAMVRAIGNIYGYKLDASAIRELLSVIGGGWVGQQLCLALFKIGMPGAGGFGGAAFVFIWTHAMGMAAEVYFSSDQKASSKQLRESLKTGFQEAKIHYETFRLNQKKRKVSA